VHEEADENRERLGGPQPPKRFARPLADAGIGALGQGDQLRHELIPLGTAGDFLGRPAAGDRRPVAQRGDEVRGGHRRAVRVEATRHDGLGHVAIIEPLRLDRFPAGQADRAER
jgi:hypothetical protein